MVTDVNHVRLHLKLVNILTKMCFHIKSGESGMQAAACHSTIAAEEESDSAELRNSWIAALASDSAELKRHIFWSHLHSSLSPDCITVSSCISNEFQIMKCGRAFHNREIWHKV